MQSFMAKSKLFESLNASLEISVPKKINSGTSLKIIMITFCGAMSLSIGACQDRLLVDDTTPFGEGVVRLGDTEVAEIDGTKLYLSDVERTAAAQGLIEIGSPLTPQNPIFQRVLDELIDQRLLALDALRQALDQQDETRRRLAVARERILGNMLVENHLQNKVNDQAVRRMYDEQADLREVGEERRVRHILVADKADIEHVQDRLAKDEDFAIIASEVSLDRVSRENGGDLGFFRKDMLDADFTRVAFSTPVGARSAPFKTEFGWHLLEVQETRTPKPKSFEDMRSEMLNFMTYDEIQKLLQMLRAKGDVKLLFGQAVERSQTTNAGSRSAETQKTEAGDETTKPGRTITEKDPGPVEAP